MTLATKNLEDTDPAQTQTPTPTPTTSSSHPKEQQQQQQQQKEQQQQQQESKSTSWLNLLYRHVYLRFFATINVPFLGMTICLNLYGLLWYFFAAGNSNPLVNTIMIAYLLYSILDNTPARGGYQWWSNNNMEWLRGIFYVRHFAEYFPVSLEKTAELTPEQGPFIFLYHPHGVIGLGACAALVTNGCDFNVKFPGIIRRSATLNASFLVPVFREWMLLLGMVSANKKTLATILKEKKSIVLIPGGAAEALYAQSGNFVCYIQGRKGFVKLALETNSKLVPCLGFGENSAFSTVTLDKQSAAFRWQQQLSKWLSFSVPIMTSPLPAGHPIHVVVGKPVQFKSTDVDECHAQYLQALQDLYNLEKAKYGHENIPIEIH